MKKTEINFENNTFTLKGKLTAQSVIGVLTKTKALVPYEQQLSVNLKEVTHCDSAGLAYLIEILRESKKKRSIIVFEEVPQQILDLSRVSGLEHLF